MPRSLLQQRSINGSNIPVNINSSDVINLPDVAGPNVTIALNTLKTDLNALTLQVNNIQTDLGALTVLVNTKIGDAPIDGNAYVRQNGQWIELTQVIPMSTYSGFGELITVEPSPVIQIDGAEG